MDKLNKISNLFAQKMNKPAVTEQVKEDPTKAQSKKPTATAADHTLKTLQSNEREEYDPARPNDYEELKKRKERQKQRDKLKSLEDAENEKEKQKKNVQTSQDSQKTESEQQKNKTSQKEVTQEQKPPNKEPGIS